MRTTFGFLSKHSLVAGLAIAGATIAGASDAPIHLRLNLTGSPERRTPELSWSSQSGAVYRIQRALSLSGGTRWETIEPVLAESSLTRWKAPELNSGSDTHFFRLLLGGPEIFTVEPARCPAGRATEVFIVGQCFGPDTALRVAGSSLESEVVHSGLMRASFTPPGLGVYEFELVRAGVVLSAFPVECHDPASPPAALFQGPPEEPLASPMHLADAGAAADADWPLGGSLMKAKEKGNRTKCSADRSMGSLPTETDVALPLSALTKVKEKANRTKCSSNLRVLPSGEVALDEVDLCIPGVGLDVTWGRRYLSRSGPHTEQGNRWDFSYNVRVQEVPGGMTVHDGQGRADLFHRDAEGLYGRDEHFSVGTLTGGVFRLTFADTGYWEFNPLDGSPASGRLSRIVDRNGNTISLHYDPLGRLTRIVDTLQRAIAVEYNPAGRISAVTDFAGRRVTYAYYRAGEAGGAAGDLKSATSPPVTGTPNKNDFADGKTTTYEYSSGFSDPRQNSLLLSITDAKGQISHRQVYQHNQSDLEFLRCIARQVGAPEQLITYKYLPQRPGPSNAFAVVKVIVNDRAGNVSECSYDARNRLLLRREFTGRAIAGLPVSDTTNRPTGKLRLADPDYFETRFDWNNDSLCTRVTHPRGDVTEMIYQRAFNQNSSRSNHSRRHLANLRILRHRACCDSDSDGDGVPDGAQLTQWFEHDPRFGAGAPGASGEDSGASLRGKIIMDRDTGRSKGFGFVTSSTDALGTTSTAIYDQRGNLARSQTYERKNGAIIAADYNYDARGRLAVLTHPANGDGCRSIDTFEYHDKPGTAGFGYLSKVTRDDRGLLCGDTDHFRLATTYEYDAVGNVIRCTDPRGFETHFVYNSLDQLMRARTPPSAAYPAVDWQMDLAYDANDNLIRVDTANLDHTGAGNSANPSWTTDYTYDELDQLSLECVEIAHEGLKACSEFQYDRNGKLMLHRSPEAVAGRQPDAVTRFDYDERNLLFQVARAPRTGLAGIERFDYDANGACRRISKIDAFTIKQKFFGRDGFGRLTRVTDAMGNVESYAYDANGNIVHRRLDGETTDEPGEAGNVRLRETHYEYDSVNRLLRSRQAFFDILTQAPIGDGQSVRSYSYAPNGQLLSEADDNGHITRYTYDSAGRLARAIDPKTNMVHYVYDACGNPTNIATIERSDVSGEQRFSVSRNYDSRGRLVSETDNVGNTDSYFYDARDNLVRHLGPAGTLTGWTYDGLNRCTVAIADLDGDGLLDYAADAGAAQTWDDNSRLIATTDDNANVTRYAYDAVGRLTAVTDADGVAHSLVWNAFDSLVGSMDPNGTVISNSYDRLERCVRRDITPGPGVAASTTFESFDYDGESRLVRASNNGTEHRFIWDSRSELGVQSGGGQSVRTFYDGEGNRISVAYPSGLVVQRSFDSLNHIATVSTVLGGRVTQHASYAYDGPGRLARIARPSGVNTRINWDGLEGTPNQPGDLGWRRVARINHARSGATQAVVDQRTFTYDAAGNKVLRAQTVSFNPGGPTETNAFAYDKLHRLVRSRKSRTFREQNVSYHLDGNGNRQAVAQDGAVMLYGMDNSTPEPADFQMNQYSLTPFGPRLYDRNGNQVSIDGPAGSIQFTYDYADRLVAVHRSVGPALQPLAEYSYDALGRQMAKTVFRPRPVAVLRSEFVYDGAQIIEEHQNGSLAAIYVLPEVDDEVLVMFDAAGQAAYLHTDDLGNALAVTDPSGRVLERYDYGDFGRPYFLDAAGDPLVDDAGLPVSSSPAGNRFLFHGMDWDSETGLYHASRGGHPTPFDPDLGRYITRSGGNNENWGFGGSTTVRTFAGNNPWSRKGDGAHGACSRAGWGAGGGGGGGTARVMFNPKEYTISKRVTVRGWDPEKKEPIVGKKEEGGRHTPFHKRCFNREMTTGLDVEYRLYGPGAAHWGQAKFSGGSSGRASGHTPSACAATGITSIRGHRDVGSY